MNSKERVKTTFKHIEPDRVPVSELYINSPAASDILGREAWIGWGGYVKGKILNKMLMEGRAEEFYSKEVKDLVDVYRKLDLDTIIIERPPLENPIIPTQIGENEWRFEDIENGLWNIWRYSPQTDCQHEADSSIKQKGIKELERYLDILDNDPIDINSWPWYQAEYIMKTCADKFIMAVAEIDCPATSFSSWGSLFLECMVLRPDLVERYLDYRVRKGLIFIEKYAKMGVDAIFDGEDLAGVNGPLFSPIHFRRYFQPRYKKLIDAAHRNNLLYMKHTDGNIMPIEKEFFEEMGIDAYQSVDPGAGMDIEYIKRKYGDKITLMGNVDCAKALVSGTPDDVVQETKKIIKKISPGGGHILSSSNTIHSEIPTENFIAMVEAAKKYGKYPINIKDC